MNKRKITILVLLFIGIILIIYPFVSNIINELNQTTVITNYQNDVENLSEEQKQEQLINAEKYNEELSKDTYIDVSLEDKQEESPSYLNVLDIGEAMGHLIIPKIEVNLPIYHGLSNDVLQNGVGHAETSSLPVGGKGTHAVLAGHTGLARLKIFDDLNELEVGDVFYISILGNLLKYQVNNKIIVEPENTDSVTIEEDKDYVTLVTCIPKYVNSHRLLVRGERAELTDEDINKDMAQDLENKQLLQNEETNSEKNTEQIKQREEILQKEFAKETKKRIINQLIKLIIIIMLLLIFIILIVLQEIKKEKKERE